MWFDFFHANLLLSSSFRWQIWLMRAGVYRPFQADWSVQTDVRRRQLSAFCQQCIATSPRPGSTLDPLFLSAILLPPATLAAPAANNPRTTLSCRVSFYSHFLVFFVTCSFCKEFFSAVFLPAPASSGCICRPTLSLFCYFYPADSSNF